MVTSPQSVCYQIVIVPLSTTQDRNMLHRLWRDCRGITLVGATYFCATQRTPQGGSLRGQPSKCFAGSFLMWGLHSNVLVVWPWPCLLCSIVGQRRVALWTEMSAISGVPQAVHLVPTAATSMSHGTRVLTSQMTCCTHSLSNSSIELHLCALLA